MLEKGVLKEVQTSKDQFLSTIFVRPKKEENKFRPIMNLNAYMPYIHFKMEGMKNVTDPLCPGDYMMKIHLKEAYWHVPINPFSQKFLRFCRQKSLYKITVLAFWVGPGPRIFTKLLKVPLTTLMRLMIIIVTYLDDFLIIGKTIEEVLQARDSSLVLLLQLGFTINWEKYMLEPSQEVKFLGMMINSLQMKIWLPVEKAQKLQNLCQERISRKTITERTSQFNREIVFNNFSTLQQLIVGEDLIGGGGQHFRKIS